MESTDPDGDGAGGGGAGGGGVAAADGAAVRRTAGNAAVMAAADILGKVATLGYTVVAARVLTQQDFGSFAYAVSLSLLLAIVPTWGFDAIVIRDGAAVPARIPRLYATSLLWRGALALPVFTAAAALLAPGRPSPEAAGALAMVLLAAALDLGSDAGRGAANAAQRLAGVSAAVAVNRIATAALAVVALDAGGGLLGISGAYLAGSATGLAATVVALRRIGIRADVRGVRPADMRDLAHRSWEIGLAGLLGAALFRVDAVLLEAFDGDEAVAVYAVAYRLLETVLFASWAVGYAIFPVMSAAAEGSRVRRVLEHGTGALAALYAPFAAVAVVSGPAVIDLLFGSRYVGEASLPLRWLAPAPLLFATAYLASYALLSRDRARQALLAAAVATGANLLLNLALIPAAGPVGAAAATTVSYALELVVCLVLLRPVIGVPALHRALLPGVGASIPLAVLLVALDLHVLVELVIGLPVYAGSWWLLARRWSPGQAEVLRTVVRRG